MRSKEDILPECPVATTVLMIGSKWKLLIMRNLLARPWRFNELQKSIDGIRQKALTELGESMRPIIKSMESWGMAHKEQTE